MADRDRAHGTVRQQAAHGGGCGPTTSAARRDGRTLSQPTRVICSNGNRTWGGQSPARKTNRCHRALPDTRHVERHDPCVPHSRSSWKRRICHESSPAVFSSRTVPRNTTSACFSADWEVRGREQSAVAGEAVAMAERHSAARMWLLDTVSLRDSYLMNCGSSKITPVPPSSS